VLVKPLEAVTTSEAIHLLGAAEKPQGGEIVAISTGQTADADEAPAFHAKVRDAVALTKHRGTELTVDGGDYVVLNFD